MVSWRRQMRSLRFLRGALGSAPLVSAAAIFSLALGIGANTTIFSLINTLSVRSLPVGDPDRLVTLSSVTDVTANQSSSFSYAVFDEIRHSQIADGALAWSQALLAIGREAQSVGGAWVSGDFFSTLRVPAFRGRTLQLSDDVGGGGADGLVAMISYRLWRRRFNGAMSAIGSELLVEGVPVTIVGVTPPRFLGIDVGRAVDAYLPFGAQALITPNAPSDVHMAVLRIKLRMRPGQSFEAATTAIRSAQP